MPLFVATPQDLLNGATNCVNTNSQVQSQIQQMQNLIQGLMGTYQGTAATQLQSLSQQWHTDSSQLNFVLETIAQGLQSNAHNYRDFEAAATANLARVQSGLPGARF
jgi:WXG100 family type VII secretion target